MTAKAIGYDELAQLTGLASHSRAITYAGYLLLGLAEIDDDATGTRRADRAEQALYGVGDLLQGAGWHHYGVEVVEEFYSGHQPGAYWYLDRGDPWAATVIVRERDGASFVGCWGDLVGDNRE